MQTHSIVLATTLLAAVFATPALAAGNGGGASGGVWPGGGGGAPSGAGPSGGAGAPSRGPSSGPGPSFRGANSFTPQTQPGLSSNFKAPHPGWTPPAKVAGSGPSQDWRRHHHHPIPGPIFVPGGSNDYAYDDQDYNDGGDPANCWVYRKAHDRAGHFLGFVHVNLAVARSAKAGS